MKKHYYIIGKSLWHSEIYGVSPDNMYFEFDNASEFARKHNLNGNNVRQVANGQKKTHKGWRFGFVSEKCTDYQKHK